MRTIKFRGEDKRGNVFYGAYNQKMGVIEDFEYAAAYAVEPETVKQLIGEDRNGREVYVGDKVRNLADMIIKADMGMIYQVKDYELVRECG